MQWADVRICIDSAFIMYALYYYRNLRNAEMIIRSSNQLKQFTYNDC